MIMSDGYIKGYASSRRIICCMPRNVVVPSVNWLYSTMTLARAVTTMNLWKCRNWYISRCYLIMFGTCTAWCFTFYSIKWNLSRVLCRVCGLKRREVAKKCVQLKDWYLSTDEDTVRLIVSIKWNSKYVMLRVISARLLNCRARRVQL